MEYERRRRRGGIAFLSALDGSSRTEDVADVNESLELLKLIVDQCALFTIKLHYSNPKRVSTAIAWQERQRGRVEPGWFRNGL